MSRGMLALIVVWISGFFLGIGAGVLIGREIEQNRTALEAAELAAEECR